MLFLTKLSKRVKWKKEANSGIFYLDTAQHKTHVQISKRRNFQKEITNLKDSIITFLYEEKTFGGEKKNYFQCNRS